LIPTLNEFFGGSPTDWINLPLAWLGAYATMLPRLQAGRALLGTEIASAGDAWGDGRARRRIIEGWRRAVTAGRPAARPRERVSAAEFARRLAEVGLGQG